METDKYIVLLQNQEKSAVKKIEKELQLNITPSEFLSSENRSFDIIDENNGVLYQNLNVLVVDHMDADQLKSALNDEKNPIIYFEKERNFFVENELDIVAELRIKTGELEDKITELEKLLKKKKKIPKIISNIDYEWGLKAIGIDQTQLTGKGVDICILDTGFDISHPDFVGRTIEGKSFIPNEDWNIDIKGHGTHCAGTAAGNVRTDTGKRYGVAKNSNLKIAKVLSNAGSGTTSSIVDAIDWAITKKFRIISMSLAAPVSINDQPSPIFESIGQRALDNNCIIIAAAGNDSNRPSLPMPVSAPANVNSIMAVAAIDSQMRIATFSNGGINASTGGAVNVCAPGVDILSSFPRIGGGEPYVLKNGTSMATPHVSGLVALYMEKFPSLSALEIWKLLEKNCKPIPELKFRDVGSGLIQSLL